MASRFLAPAFLGSALSCLLTVGCGAAPAGTLAASAPKPADATLVRVPTPFPLTACEDNLSAEPADHPPAPPASAPAVPVVAAAVVATPAVVGGASHALAVEHAAPAPAAEVRLASVAEALPAAVRAAVPVAAGNDGPGYVTLDTYPWTHVTLDGQALGDTPLFHVAIPPGTHTLRLDNVEENLHESTVVSVREGQTFARRLAFMDM